ncbi:hypothetical protein SLA2020_068610 [Shorea laevis]
MYHGGPVLTPADLIGDATLPRPTSWTAMSRLVYLSFVNSFLQVMESPGSITSRNMVQTPEDNNSLTKISIQRIQSFETKTRLEPGEAICRTNSLSSKCSININELVRGASGTFDDDVHIFHKENGEKIDETGSFPSRTSSNESIRGATFPSDKSSDNATSQENSDSSSWSKTQIEPSLPICLKFEDVKYKVPAKNMKSSGSKKYILHGITGSVHPGEVLALMGPSGGGKTTLLNLLSGRVKFNSGTITYNDQPYTRSLIGFVMQDDVAFPHLTVKETLTYAALLHLPSTLTLKQKKGRAMDVINELGLERCQNTMIGGAFVRGISGGERKRVCIGTEILFNPSLLFLDEPTSGLDSTTALWIVQMLQDIAKSGKTLVTTIHQPSSRLFSTFDKLILLGEGSSLYFGKASEAMLYFSSIGCSPLIAMNPAEFLIDLANGNINDKSVPLELEDMTSPGEDRGPSAVLVHEYLVEAYAAKIARPEKTKAQKPVITEGEPEMQGGCNSVEWGATWWEQFSILSRRGLKERRHHNFSYTRVIQVLTTAIITGLLWWHSDASSPQNLKDQGGLLFFISVFWGFFPLFTSIFIFPQERAMLVKERSVGMYKLSA